MAKMGNASCGSAADRSEAVVSRTAVVAVPDSGVATATNFQPTGGGKAAITGDFVMTAGEVTRVIRALLEPVAPRLAVARLRP
jgi:glutamate dehydrogenase/leucine dehydrogenase